ncbi:uncharacterized protein [Watersipora subatra]|uniref:uncharacterized protein n=1 Tax=Watersipora subatra TaxID=2589382 RepID=UPI00355C5A8D
MDGGPSSTDYMLVQLVNGKIYMEYQFGQSRDGSAYFNKTDVDVKLNTSTTVSIERVRMAFRVTLGGNKGANYLVPNYGSDLCFGPCSIRVVGNELKYDLSPGNSDLYIGGLPSTIKARAQSRARNLGNPFQGRIYDVYYKNCSDAPTNPGVINKGSAISPSSDACYDETSFGEVCQLGEGGEDCPCFPENYVKRASTGGRIAGLSPVKWEPARRVPAVVDSGQRKSSALFNSHKEQQAKPFRN